MKLATTPLGQHLRKLRVARGMVLQDMADAMGISSAHASSIELGRTEVTLEYIDKAVLFFQLDEAGKQALIQAADMFNVWDNQALAAYQAGQFDDAMSFWDKAAKAPGTAKVQIAKALYNQATTLEHLAQHDKALQTYNEILVRYSIDDDSEINVVYATALINKGAILQILRKDAVAALLLYRDLLQRYRDSGHAELRLLCAKALFNISTMLQQTDAIKAMEACDDVVNHYGSDKGQDIRSECAKALFNKGFTLKELAQHDDAIEVWESIIQRYGNDNDNSETRQLCVQALFNTGFTFKKQAKHDQVERVLQDMVTRYGSDTDTTITAVVNNARQCLRPEKADFMLAEQYVEKLKNGNKYH